MAWSDRYFSHKNKIFFYIKFGLWAHGLFVKWAYVPGLLSVQSWDAPGQLRRHRDDFPDIKVHGANKGPIWGRQDPGGPHVGPKNIAIWVYSGWTVWWWNLYCNICYSNLTHHAHSKTKTISCVMATLLHWHMPNLVLIVWFPVNGNMNCFVLH